MPLSKTGEYTTYPFTPERRAHVPSAFDRLIGASEVMQAAFERLRRASLSDATILLQGETGTGKEAVAEAIHLTSRRRNGPFIVVDCGAMPANLMEAELFGHEKGAFTGANIARPGCFEAANNGTVFLDEIGELDVSLQPKLLRVLERKHVKRLGSTDYKNVDVRIIAATNRDLRREVETNTFRSDLFFRLAVVSAALPPLRARVTDLPALIKHILNMLGDVPDDIERMMLDPEFHAELARYTWPGNIRELRNHIECCVALGESKPPGSVERDITGVLPLDQLALDLSLPIKDARDACLRAFEHRYLQGQLSRHHGNVSAAARAAGVDRAHFYRLLWKYGLREPGAETREMPVIPDLTGADSTYE